MSRFKIVVPDFFFLRDKIQRVSEMKKTPEVELNKKATQI